jgi:hypothetical protein
MLATSFTPYSPDTSLPEVYIFDIDGTLAHIDADNPRDVYDGSRAHEDILDGVVSDILRMVWRDGKNIIIMSARNDEHRDVTENWLSIHRIPYDHLYMTPKGDPRNDDHIKHDLFYEHVAPNYWVRGVFEDRAHVVDMWRSIGLKCLQVQEGNF